MEWTTVDVVLLFRRAFIDLASQKDWEIHDIVMESEVISVSGSWPKKTGLSET
jgi:hypothetical protein